MWLHFGQNLELPLFCGEVQNCKMDNSVTRFLLKPFQQTLWFFYYHRNRGSTKNLRFCNIGFYAQRLFLHLVSICIFSVAVCLGITFPGLWRNQYHWESSVAPRLIKTANELLALIFKTSQGRFALPLQRNIRYSR